MRFAGSSSIVSISQHAQIQRRQFLDRRQFGVQDSGDQTVDLFPHRVHPAGDIQSRAPLSAGAASGGVTWTSQMRLRVGSSPPGVGLLPGVHSVGLATAGRRRSSAPLFARAGSQGKNRSARQSIPLHRVPSRRRWRAGSHRSYTCPYTPPTARGCHSPANPQNEFFGIGTRSPAGAAGQPKALLFTAVSATSKVLAGPGSTSLHCRYQFPCASAAPQGAPPPRHKASSRARLPDGCAPAKSPIYGLPLHLHRGVPQPLQTLQQAAQHLAVRRPHIQRQRDDIIDHHVRR